MFKIRKAFEIPLDGFKVFRAGGDNTSIGIMNCENIAIGDIKNTIGIKDIQRVFRHFSTNNYVELHGEIFGYAHPDLETSIRELKGFGFAPVVSYVGRDPIHPSEMGAVGPARFIFDNRFEPEKGRGHKMHSKSGYNDFPDLLGDEHLDLYPVLFANQPINLPYPGKSRGSMYEVVDEETGNVDHILDTVDTKGLEVAVLYCAARDYNVERKRQAA